MNAASYPAQKLSATAPGAASAAISGVMPKPSSVSAAEARLAVIAAPVGEPAKRLSRSLASIPAVNPAFVRSMIPLIAVPVAPTT